MHEIGGLPDEAVALFEDRFFGKLVVEFTQDSVREYFPDEPDSPGHPKTYRVTSASDREIVIEELDEDTGAWFPTTYYIDGSDLYVFTGRTSFREYFRRLR